jgi:hypothetical protein
MQKLKSHLLQHFSKSLWLLILSLCVLTLCLSSDPVSGFLISTLIVVSGIVVNVFRRYADFENFKLDCAISLAIGYYLCFSSIVLLPIDTAVSIMAMNGYVYSNFQNFKDSMLIVWKFIFWGKTFLSLFQMIQFQYHQTGYLTFVKKLKQVFRNLVKIILIACFVAGVLIIVFVWAFGIGVQDIYVLYIVY